MFEGLTVEVVLALLKKFWLPILIGAISLSILGYIAFLRWDNRDLTQKYSNAQHDISTAVDANSQNVKAFNEMKKEQDEERAATAQAAERAKALSESAEQVKKEMRNDPQANTPAGPFFDSLSVRLRALQQATGGH